MFTRAVRRTAASSARSSAPSGELERVRYREPVQRSLHGGRRAGFLGGAAARADRPGTTGEGSAAAGARPAGRQGVQHCRRHRRRSGRDALGAVGGRFTAALERQAVRAQLMAATGRQAGEHRGRAVPVRPAWWSPIPDCATRWATGRSGWPARQDLVEQLLAGRATAATWPWPSGQSRRAERTFATPSKASSRSRQPQKNRLVATVRVAKPLTSEQRDRLRRSLSKQVGREVAMQEIIDPDVLGGVRGRARRRGHRRHGGRPARAGPTALRLAGQTRTHP